MKETKKLDPNDAPEGYAAIQTRGATLEDCAKCAFGPVTSEACKAVKQGCAGSDREDGCSVYFLRKPTKSPDADGVTLGTLNTPPVNPESAAQATLKPGDLVTNINQCKEGMLVEVSFLAARGYGVATKAKARVNVANGGTNDHIYLRQDVRTGLAPPPTYSDYGYRYSWVVLADKDGTLDLGAPDVRIEYIKVLADKENTMATKTKAENGKAKPGGKPSSTGLTKADKELLANKVGQTYAFLSHEAKVVLDNHWNTPGVVEEHNGEEWAPVNHTSAAVLYGVYRISPNAATGDEYEIHEIGSGGGRWEDSHTGTYLDGVISLINFAGIQYEGRTDWIGVLDTVTYGKPVKVRYRK